MKSSSANQKNMKNVSEADLIGEALFRLRSLNNLSACREVPLLGRSPDIAFLLNDAVITVEFKLNNWRQAVIQARDHQLGADYSYICMPKRNISVELENLLLENGIGLFFYCEDGNWPFLEVIKARQSADLWEYARESLYNYILAHKELSDE
ncbi:MAG: hypothetical protein HZB44_03850 [Actinobacteria bacterium]|nr:hypothetical protein [Actinomycetota bacterium]